MGWWRFKRESTVDDFVDDPHIKGTRYWLNDLRYACEISYDDYQGGQKLVRELQEEWKTVYAKDELNADLHVGLELRAAHLLRCEEEDWLTLLDNEEFWLPGWRPAAE